MVGTDLARCGAMLAAAGAVAVIGPVVPVLVAVAAVLSLLNAFFVPASGALRPQLLPAKHLVRGNAATCWACAAVRRPVVRSAPGWSTSAGSRSSPASTR